MHHGSVEPVGALAEDLESSPDGPNRTSHSHHVRGLAESCAAFGGDLAGRVDTIAFESVVDSAIEPEHGSPHTVDVWLGDDAPGRS